MKNIVFFITHKTLSLKHANATFYSMSKQDIRDTANFDVLYIYNTHEDELSNENLLELYKKYDLARFFNSVEIFPYDKNTHKSLGGDTHAIRTFMQQRYLADDRYLMLKSDCVLSKNYFDEILHIGPGLISFIAPFICAKERLTDEEIFEYAERDRYIPSDSITFFVEDQFNSPNNDFNNRPGVNVTDHEIKFTSCYVITDFSAHFISVELASKMNINTQSWGGVKFYLLAPFFIGTDRCFVIHKYHDIISENRSTDREGPVKTWLKS